MIVKKIIELCSLDCTTQPHMISATQKHNLSFNLCDRNIKNSRSRTKSYRSVLDPNPRIPSSMHLITANSTWQ